MRPAGGPAWGPALPAPLPQAGLVGAASAAWSAAARWGRGQRARWGLPAPAWLTPAAQDRVGYAELKPGLCEHRGQQLHSGFITEGHALVVGGGRWGGGGLHQLHHTAQPTSAPHLLQCPGGFPGLWSLSLDVFSRRAGPHWRPGWSWRAARGDQSATGCGSQHS